MPITTELSHLSDRRPDSTSTPAARKSTFKPRASPQLDLRIVVFMFVVAVVQLLTFKRPLT